MAGQHGDDTDLPDPGPPPGGRLHPESLLIAVIVAITILSALLRLFG